MITTTIDLYEYFGLEKPELARGLLSVYVPDRHVSHGANRKRPSVLVMPGGGYSYTSEREAEPVAMKFLAKGYNAFVLYYSCEPAPFPYALQEAGMAMVYIREHGEEFGVREDRVVSIGFSAGGHLCGSLATLFNDPALDFLGDKKKLVRPEACVLMYPCISTKFNDVSAGCIAKITYGDNDLLNYLSLEDRVSEDSVPAYIFATLGDGCVPAKNSLVMACAYHEKGVPYCLHILEKGYHGLSVNDVTCDTPESIEERKGSTPENYSDWISQVFTWLEERDFKVITNN